MNKSFVCRNLLVAICVAISFACSIDSHAQTGGCGSGQAPMEANRGEPVFNSGNRYPISIILRPGITRTVEQYYDSDTKYLRVLLKGNARLRTADWRLTVRDSEYRSIQVFGPADFEDSTILWTTRIPGETVFLVFESDDDSLRIRVSEYVAMPELLKNTYYSVLDPDNPRYVDLYPLTGRAGPESYADKALGDSVGLMLTSYGEQAWTCSGVVVADDLFLTNWHCGAPKPLEDHEVWLQDICDSALIDLSWDNDTISRDYRCVEPVAKSKSLDFALLKIQPLRDAGQPKPAKIGPTRISSLETVKIIHHPLGLTKQISAGCSLTALSYDSPMAEGEDSSDFTHNCDTGQGSSGAPVFDSTGVLIGLHHLGFMLNQEKTTCDNANKAVWIGNIVDFIRTADAAAAERMNIVD